MSEVLTIAINNLKSQKLRTALTLLGIVIGIGAIIGLITVSDGLENYLFESMEGLGSNRIMIMPGSMGSAMSMAAPFFFDDDDVDLISSVSGVKATGGMSYGMGVLDSRGETFVVNIAGLNSETFQDLYDGMGIALSDGKWPDNYRPGDLMIGSRIHTGTFKRDVNVRDRVEINDIPFTITGVFEEVGNPEDDRNIYMDSEDWSEVMGVPVQYMMIMAATVEGTDPLDIAEDIERKMLRRYDEDEFSITTFDQLLEQMSQVMGILTIVLSGIAGISLVVAGIGIMNTMLMAVMERTKEIGIMKAVGANRNQILIIFLVETVIISLLGGVCGVLLGFAISKGVEAAAASYGLKLIVRLTPRVISLGIGFALLVGLLSGIYPAWKAAKMNPVDAIRYS